MFYHFIIIANTICHRPCTSRNIMLTSHIRYRYIIENFLKMDDMLHHLETPCRFLCFKYFTFKVLHIACSVYIGSLHSQPMTTQMNTLHNFRIFKEGWFYACLCEPVQNESRCENRITPFRKLTV